MLLPSFFFFAVFLPLLFAPSTSSLFLSSFTAAAAVAETAEMIHLETHENPPCVCMFLLDPCDDDREKERKRKRFAGSSVEA